MPMPGGSRENEILKLLMSQRSKTVTVKQICSHCFISESSARRDLHKLEQAGLIKRVHGGARLISVEDVYKTDNAEDSGIGGKVADEVVSLVSDGFAIFLDSSAISCSIVPLLQNFDDITVITPNIKAVTLLSIYPAVRTICVCGVVQNELLSASGSYAENFIDNFNVDLAFVCGSGFDTNAGLSDVSMNEANIKKKMLSRAKKRVIACPSDRIGSVSRYLICDTKGFDTLITDSKLTPEKAESLMAERISFRCV